MSKRLPWASFYTLCHRSRKVAHGCADDRFNIVIKRVPSSLLEWPSVNDFKPMA